jgi:hypothetical protein
MKSQKYVLHCIYRHPGPLHKDFLTSLENNCAKEKSTTKQLIIGDININILNDTCPMTTEYLNMMSEFKFLPLILSPTRIINDKSSLIDHIMHNGYDGNMSYSGNIYTDISDHLPNYALIPLSNPKSPLRNRPFTRLFINKNIIQFQKEMHDIDWNNMELKNIEETFLDFYNRIQSSFEDCFPLIKVSIKKHKMKPWLTSYLLKNIKKNNKLYKKYACTKSSIDHERYLYYKRLVTKSIHIAKKNITSHYSHSIPKISKRHGKVSGKLWVVKLPLPVL